METDWILQRFCERKNVHQLAASVLLNKQRSLPCIVSANFIHSFPSFQPTCSSSHWHCNLLNIVSSLKMQNHNCTPTISDLLEGAKLAANERWFVRFQFQQVPSSCFRGLLTISQALKQDLDLPQFPKLA